jgi:hypothetical protein
MHFNELTSKEKDFVKKQKQVYKSVYIDKNSNFNCMNVYGEEVALNYNKSSKILSVVFDGSNSAKEWKSNAKIMKTQSDDLIDDNAIKFHTGFYRSFQSIYEEVLEKILYRYDLKHVIIRGYSRGAVFTALLHRKIRKYHPKMTVQSVSFGMPCFMNYKAALFCNHEKWLKDFISIEHYQDIVPHVLEYKMGFVPTPCKRVYIGSKWAKAFRWWKKISVHMNYFNKT